MINPELTRIARDLIGLTVPNLDPGASAICHTIASGSLDETLIVATDALSLESLHDTTLRNAATITFDELSRQPYRALTARKLVGALDATKLIAREELDIVEQCFFTRPRGTCAFVFLEASRIADAADLERVRRSGWRLLVPEPKPRWLQQNLGEHGVYLLDHRASNDELELSFDETRRDLDRFAADDAATDALARNALVYAADVMLRAVERINEVPPSSAALFRQRELDTAHDELAQLKTRALRRLDTEGAALQRVMETAILRLRQDLVGGLDGALRGGESVLSLQTRQKLGRNFQQFVTRTIDQWIATSQVEIERRAEELERDVVRLVRDADWAAVNRAIGHDADFPQPIVDALQRALRPAGRVGAPPLRTPQVTQKAVGAAHAGILVLGSSLIYGVTALAGAIPAVVTSLLLGAGGWAIYREQGIRHYAEHGHGVIHGLTEQLRLQVEETIDTHVRELRSKLQEELRLAIDRVAAASLHARIPPARDPAPLRALRDALGTLDLDASAITGARS